MADRPVDSMRREYGATALDESSAHPNPIEQFRTWFESARSIDPHEANAMTLATVDGDGRPAARIVLLKDFNESGFVFYTNRASAKGRALAENPECALVFWWPSLERQVRVEGTVSLVDDATANEYFASRPRQSQLGAAASEQSSVISDRATLESRFAELNARFANQPIPRPPTWGGYCVKPRAVEFWQGRESRMHDRLLYTRSATGGWVIRRLSP
ncbi:MAG: pyridoxamine 5'-phosphate oxidase [Phycisphaerae bacterium]